MKTLFCLVMCSRYSRQPEGPLPKASQQWGQEPSSTHRKPDYHKPSQVYTQPRAFCGGDWIHPEGTRLPLAIPEDHSANMGHRSLALKLSSSLSVMLTVQIRY